MNDIILIESRTAREEYMGRVDVLEKVKALSLLPDDMNATVEQVAEYYEVGRKTIDSLILDHRDELETDGLRVLKGDELFSFKGMGVIGKNTASLTIIPRRAILRIGMLLRDSEIAKRVRDYLLAAEAQSRQIAHVQIEQIKTDWSALTDSVEGRRKMFQLVGFTKYQALTKALKATQKETAADLSEYIRLAKAKESLPPLLNAFIKCLQDKRLSWGAKGIYGFLMRMQIDGVFNQNYREWLERNSGERKGMIEVYVSELKEYGYLPNQTIIHSLICVVESNQNA